MSGIEILAPLLFMLAIVLLVLAAFDVKHPRLNLGWLGVAALAGADLVLVLT